MRIDAHTHVFTLYSIMSREAIRVITERLGKYVSPMLAEAIGQVLYDQLDKPEYMDEHRFLQKLLAKLLEDTSFSDVATSLFANSPIETQITGDLDALAAGAISDIITRVLDGVDGGGTAGKVLDVVETLRQSMQPTITDVSDDLLKHMDDPRRCLRSGIIHGRRRGHRRAHDGHLQRSGIRTGPSALHRAD